MLTMTGNGVGAINGLITLGGQELGLRQLRPVAEMCCFTAVHATHLLQTNDVRIELFHRMTQVMDFKPPGGTQTLHALVDVVTDHPQNRVLMPLGFQGETCCEKRGNIKMASALDAEKHWSAAACKGNHCDSVCSCGLNTIG